MARSKILLDSNAYIRLARSIRPLLDDEFGGEERFTLYVIADLASEYARNRRLKGKFAWLQEAEYVANRQRPLQLSKAEKNLVESAYDYVSQHVRAEKLPPSKVDVRAIATASVLGIRLVTDDLAMRELGTEYGVEMWSTLRLMALMLEVGHIDRPRVREIARYWQQDRDVPGGFHIEYRQLFDEAPPKDL